ncbi:MAG: hypothetical protein AMXMBFR74_16780 [Parvibaculum sp.]
MTKGAETEKHHSWFAHRINHPVSRFPSRFARLPVPDGRNGACMDDDFATQAEVFAA